MGSDPTGTVSGSSEAKMKHRFALTLATLGLALLASAVPGGVVNSADAEGAKSEWKRAGKQVRTNLTGRVYSKSLLDAVESAAGE